jgi:hypothetical protein
MSIVTRSESSGNPGGVVQVIQPPTEQLLSYQLPGGIVGQLSGRYELYAMPPGRYTETRAPHSDGTVWIENAHGDHWRVRVDDIRQYALEPDAHTARQIARRKAYDRYRALDWCERLLDLADQWPDIIDHLPCDDATAEAIGDLLDQVVAKVKGVKP